MSEIEYKRLSETSFSVIANNTMWGNIIQTDVSDKWGFIPGSHRVYPHWILSDVCKRLDALNISFK